MPQLHPGSQAVEYVVRTGLVGLGVSWWAHGVIRLKAVARSCHGAGETSRRTTWRDIVGATVTPWQPGSLVFS